MDIELQDEIKKTTSYYNLYNCIKRLLDVLISIIFFILFIPIMLIIKILFIYTKDYNTIFYTQERIGKNGKKFEIYKFRTMVYNSDKVLKQLLKEKKYKEEWKIQRKLKDDPRVTKIGKFLRKTHIDELPQVINVLKGDMSIIGPRPLIENELDDYKGNHELYESIKPGMSGWWAVNGGNDISGTKRLELEYYYIENYNFLLDIKIVAKTIKLVFNKLLNK